MMLSQVGITGAQQTFGSPRYSLQTDWISIKSDIDQLIRDGKTVNEFDETGLYEKYISTSGFTDPYLNSISDAGFISEKLLEKLIKQILSEFNEFVSLVNVPNLESDRTENLRQFSKVIKFGRNKYKQVSKKKCNSSERSSIYLNAAHHPRELVSIQMIAYTMLRLLFEY